MRAIVLILMLLLVAATWWWSSSTVPPAGPIVVPVAVPTIEPERIDVAARESVPVPAPETSGVLVRVIDAATGAAVPAAAVSWCGQGLGKPPAATEDFTERAFDPEAFHRERGVHGVTDSRGEVCVPAEGWLAVVARAGNRYGEATAPRRVTELTVALHPDTALAIRTVDAAGWPVAGVAVRFACAWRDAGKAPVTWQALLPASDLNGMTALPHVQEFVSPRIAERLAQFQFSNAVEWQSATLAACVTFGEGPPVAVDLRHLPPQPIDVVVPGVASLEFVLRGPDGAPFPLQPSPQLRAVLVPKGGMAQPIEAGILTQPWSADGRAVFPHVVCGERLELLGRTNWYEGMKFDGPTRPGEHLVVAVNMSADAVWILGRLLGEDGAPWTREARLRMGGNSVLPGNAAGHFCVPVPEHVGRQPRAFVDGDSDSDGGAVEAEIVFRTPLAVGQNDVGTVVLKRPPLLVSGQVVVRDAEDGPAMLKTLRAHIESWNPEHFFGRADRLPVELDAQGRFTVHALPRNVDYGFFVDGNVARGGFRKFEPGTMGLVLEVSPGGSIEASFLVDPAWGTLTIVFARAEAISTSLVPCDSGRAVADVENLEAGEYRVVAAKGPLVLAELLVTVPPGKAAVDPRLRDFDLRDHGHAVQVVVTDVRGAAIDGEVQIGWRPAGTGDEQWSVQRYTHDAGRGTTILSSGAIDVCVWAAGHRAVSKAGVLEVAGLVLQPLPQVTVRWADAPELPPGGTAHLVWERLENGPPAADAARGAMRAAEMVREAQRGGPLPGQLVNGTAKCSAEPGERLRVRLQLRAGGKHSDAIAVTPAELDGSTFVDGQTIELRAEPAAVQAALRQLAGK